MDTPFEIFLATAPGLEPLLQAEAAAAGFADPVAVPGGVTITGGWPEVMRANLTLRGASRVLARVGSFRALHLAQLDKRARKFPWADVLRPDTPVKVEATCAASRIYHAGAAAERVGRAIAETLGAPLSDAEDAIRVMVRIDDDLCTLSVDTSGAPLHRRGHKAAVGKAPLRETLAALFLRAAGYAGSEPVLDPMCGSGTFPIEAAEIATGLLPGRTRDFAFERLARFDAALWAGMKSAPARPSVLRFFGSDRDQGVIGMARQNADRAGVAGSVIFDTRAISALERPEGPPGLVIINPPWGERIGARKLLFALHGSLGEVLRTRFGGWRVAVVSPDPGLIKAAALPFLPPGPYVDQGGTRVRLYQTRPLP